MFCLQIKLHIAVSSCLLATAVKLLGRDADVRFANKFTVTEFAHRSSGSYVTHSLTYSMEQSLSWEANRFSAIQEIPRI